MAYIHVSTILLLGSSSGNNHAEIFHCLDRLILLTHTVCKFCEQYCQDATGGLLTTGELADVYYVKNVDCML